MAETPRTRAQVRTRVRREYGRPIAHMLERKAIGRFGLVFGAGASLGLGFPKWDELLRRIARHPEVDAADLTADTDTTTSQAQLLVQHYRSKRFAESELGDDMLALAYDIEVGWKRIVHKCLYDGVDPERIERASYLGEYLPLIRSSPLTINYNFDDSLQRMLQRDAKGSRAGKGFETLWTPQFHVGARRGTIYHPNGYLPLELDAEQPSEELVFLEESFADQLIETMSGRYSSLLSHFSQTTCLLIGLSLRDPTLRHLLRQNATLNPGHYHYYVSYVAPDDTRTVERRRAEFTSNFEVYNLITLFLDEPQLAALGEVLAQDAAGHARRMNELGLRSSYRFFLAGPVGVGKTSALSHLRSLRVLAEWLEALPPEMLAEPKTLTPEQHGYIDTWVNEQLERKNNILFDSGPGIDVVDRSPLDPFAFVPPDLWPQRAAGILDGLERSHTERRQVPGHVIVLTGTAEVIKRRAGRVFRAPELKGVQRQQGTFEWLYDGRAGVSFVDTRDRSVAAVVSKIAEVIHTGEYEEFDFQQWLADMAGGKIPLPEHG